MGRNTEAGRLRKWQNHDAPTPSSFLNKLHDELHELPFRLRDAAGWC
jgi:hypothetical protein